LTPAGEVSFRYKDNRGLEHIRTNARRESFSLACLLRHVLPRRFRRRAGFMAFTAYELQSGLGSAIAAWLLKEFPVPSPRINLSTITGV